MLQQKVAEIADSNTQAASSQLGFAPCTCLFSQDAPCVQITMCMPFTHQLP